MGRFFIQVQHLDVLGSNLTLFTGQAVKLFFLSQFFVPRYKKLTQKVTDDYLKKWDLNLIHQGSQIYQSTISLPCGVLGHRPHHTSYEGICGPRNEHQSRGQAKKKKILKFSPQMFRKLRKIKLKLHLLDWRVFFNKCFDLTWIDDDWRLDVSVVLGVGVSRRTPPGSGPRMSSPFGPGTS